MKLVFPSIVNPEKHQFIYDSFAYGGDNTVAYAFQYQELRGGNSYSGERALPVSMVGDYLASFATALSNNDEALSSCYYLFTSEPELEEIKFAATVIFKAPKAGKRSKTRYYSKQLRRISSVEAKRYDRRFEPIEEHHNGSPESIMKLILSNDRTEGIVRFAHVCAVRKWFCDIRKKTRANKYEYMEQPAKFIGWAEDYDQVDAIQAAWEACKYVVAIYEAKRNFKNKIDRFTERAMITKLES